MLKSFKVLGMLALVVVVGVAGLYVGSKLRDRVRPRPAAAPAAEFMKHALMPGAEFPDVALFDAAGTSVDCRELLDGGGVVLFLDPDCSPCTDMGRRWQHAIDEEMVPVGRVWAVSYQPREVLDAYAGSHGFTFPVYEDRDRVFATEYGVKHYPLEIVVGVSGFVRRASYDSVSPVDAAAIGEWLAH